MTQERRDRYNTGWNDVAYGIMTWVPHPEWDSALEWAMHMEEIAGECKRSCSLTHNVDYYDGAMACADEYQRTGAIARK